MNPRRKLVLLLTLLGAAHLVIACAGFFAPYNPTSQDRDRPYAPPMRVHWIDSHAKFHARPFVYAQQLREGSFDEYISETSHPIPLNFFVSGAQYKLLGLIPMRLHFFGAESVDAPVFLLGSDAFGRDLLSRMLYGGQIS
jgi:peptide/nickel transport system permease protein